MDRFDRILKINKEIARELRLTRKRERAVGKIEALAREITENYDPNLLAYENAKAILKLLKGI